MDARFAPCSLSSKLLNLQKWIQSIQIGNLSDLFERIGIHPFWELQRSNQPGQVILGKSEVGRNLCAFPVPLHPKKEFIRGYNQAEIICKGIAESSGIELRKDLLKRVSFTESQTKKGKTSRWDNMQNRFKLQSVKNRTLKHLVVVDDVVTTGSTLETCVRILQKEFPHAKISVAVLAVAE